MNTKNGLQVSRQAKDAPSLLSGTLQRSCACGQHKSGGGECTGCGKAREARSRHSNLDGRHASDRSNGAPPLVHDVLRSSGLPLEPGARALMESRFGRDFSKVQIHTDAKAQESARQVNALAYTVGGDIVFAEGQYSPNSDRGRGLLAHELMHVVQQGGERPANLGSLRVSDQSEPAEREAQQAEAEHGSANHTVQDAATSEPEAAPCASGNCQSLPRLLESVLPADPKARAVVLGQVFSQKATGVDGNWLSAHLDLGRPLDPRTRTEMEERFGEDFSNVRVHTSGNADLVATTLNANAVTIGQHIAFADGQFDPTQESGRGLLMHELAHTVQQKNVSTIPSQTVPITRPSHTSEHEAEAVARMGGNESTHTVSPQLSRATGPQISLSVCGVMVEGACWAAFSAIAAAIAALCVVGTTITVGGLAIPCTAIVIASAGMAAWDAVMCTNILKQEICGEPITPPATS